MKRIVLAALAAPLCLWAEEAAPRVELKAPEFRQTQPGPVTLRDAIEGMSEADLRALLGLLRENYLAPEKLDELAVLRATAQGLFERFSPGFLLPETQPTEANADHPFRSEIVEERVGYLRLGQLVPGTLDELDSALKTFREHQIEAVVLDLRAVPTGSEFELAARITERFCQKGRVLFTIRRPALQQEDLLTSKRDPGFSGVLITLTDADTSGAAEVIAATLRTQAHALVIGQQTRGEAVEYADLPLPSGRKVRVAVAEVALAANQKVFPGGVAPDIAIEVTLEETARVLKAGLDGGVAPLISETERPRLNEAALVAGTNPELDAARQREGKLSVPILRDTMLQRALDTITSISLFGQKPREPR